MAKQAKNTKKREIRNYTHKGKKRLNNPPVGLVTPETDQDQKKKIYAYDPHLDPQLTWAGKAEHSSFEVPTVSLHVHERIDPRSIIQAVKRRNGNGNGSQLPLFTLPEENPPIREAIEFYKHKHNWSNRLIAGDSLLVMNSLLEKEGMGGKVQMVYIDPPYGIRYGSNFQPFISKRNLGENDKDEDLTTEPEMLKAFRDTWELGIHSYLTYLRDRLFLAKNLLSDDGSVFVQISDENVMHVREILDEVFGIENFVVTIALKKKGGQKAGLMAPVNDFILWSTKGKEAARSKFRPLFKSIPDDELVNTFNLVELPDGRELTINALSKEKDVDYIRFPKEIENDFPGAKLFSSENSTSGGFRRTQSVPYKYKNVTYDPGKGNCWKHSAITDDGSPSGMDRLANAGRLYVGKNQLRFKRFATDFPFSPVTNWWDEFGGASNPIYVVQTNPEVIKRCILMTTDPGDLVIDITCGSGTTAVVAEEWGRRWITCDSSRIALSLSKQRLMTLVMEYYQLAYPDEGVDSGFLYKTAEHITSSTIANDELPVTRPFYDQPLKESGKVRVCGPFTVEAVPAPAVKSLDDIENGSSDLEADETVARSGETRRQGDWRDELFKTGIRGKGGQRIEFSRVEPMGGTHWLHADGETKETKPQRIVVSFGPEHAPLEQRQVALAIEEAQSLVPKPRIIVFAAFQFDPEASKDIDETNWPGVTLLKAQMNADLLTEDLKKKRASNESFWLIGQPDVKLAKIKKGDDSGKFRVEVQGFDYYNTKTGAIDSGNRNVDAGPGL